MRPRAQTPQRRVWPLTTLSAHSLSLSGLEDCFPAHPQFHSPSAFAAAFMLQMILLLSCYNATDNHHLHQTPMSSALESQMPVTNAWDAGHPHILLKCSPLQKPFTNAYDSELCQTYIYHMRAQQNSVSLTLPFVTILCTRRAYLPYLPYRLSPLWML